jgi:hypothetical protein
MIPSTMQVDASDRMHPYWQSLVQRTPRSAAWERLSTISLLGNLWSGDEAMLVTTASLPYSLPCLSEILSTRQREEEKSAIVSDICCHDSPGGRDFLRKAKGMVAKSVTPHGKVSTAPVTYYMPQYRSSIRPRSRPSKDSKSQRKETQQYDPRSSTAWPLR